MSKDILHFFNAFNCFFSSSQNKNLLHSKAVNFLIQVTQNFLKPELIKHIFTNITFSQQHNHKSINDINLGSERMRRISS